ncbi:MAG: thioredoxin family protein [Candidatus Bathyarchaeia archaeon]|jgi:thioredoxin-like negative regulator of GroEL|nr:thioredoxin [Candidatus Bathyarchaeota archaeon A05DMB-4]MDH7596094.1 thioredoxin [Candidatus Bathyarchaeota archaeon]
MMFGNIVVANATNWEKEVLKSDKLVLVMFWHQQCPYCKILDPVFAELSREYAGKLKFAKFNVLENQENQTLASMYGILGTPTLKFFCQGRPIQDIVGALEKDLLRQGIDFAVNKHRDCAEKSTPLKLPYIS